MSKKPIDFFMPKSEKATGRNDGDKAGAGTGGTCVCTKCDYEVAHKTGQKCSDLVCPECGAKMTRGQTRDEPNDKKFRNTSPADVSGESPKE